jgi:hypothetical protein
MNRLEIVHLRSSGEPLESLGKRIRESIGPEDSGTEVVTVYRRQGLETDVAVHIHHNNTQGTDGPSGLAIHLANALRIFGLVEHTVWVELP